MFRILPASEDTIKVNVGIPFGFARHPCTKIVDSNTVWRSLRSSQANSWRYERTHIMSSPCGKQCARVAVRALRRTKEDAYSRRCTTTTRKYFQIAFLNNSPVEERPGWIVAHFRQDYPYFGATLTPGLRLFRDYLYSVTAHGKQIRRANLTFLLGYFGCERRRSLWVGEAGDDRIRQDDLRHRPPKDWRTHFCQSNV